MRLGDTKQAGYAASLLVLSPSFLVLTPLFLRRMRIMDESGAAVRDFEPRPFLRNTINKFIGEEASVSP